MIEKEYECPSCHKIVSIDSLGIDELDIDDTHVEGQCPFCQKFCCFSCEHVYAD